MGLLFPGCRLLILKPSSLDALEVFAAVIAMMDVFAFVHGRMYSEPADLMARFSARGLMRMQAISTCVATVLTAQYAGFWQHETIMSFIAEGVSVLCWLAFAAVYGRYANKARDDAYHSPKLIFKAGSGRTAVLQMATITIFGFIPVGIAAGNAMWLLAAICAAMVATIVFAFTSHYYIDKVTAAKDRG